MNVVEHCFVSILNPFTILVTTLRAMHCSVATCKSIDTVSNPDSPTLCMLGPPSFALLLHDRSITGSLTCAVMMVVWVMVVVVMMGMVVVVGVMP